MACPLKSIPNLFKKIQNFAIPKLWQHFIFKNIVRYLSVVYQKNFESKVQISQQFLFDGLTAIKCRLHISLSVAFTELPGAELGVQKRSEA